MKILITGVCGFIGYNLADYFLNQNKKIQIYGLDSMDKYYSVKLKQKRLKMLNNNKFFYFKKINLLSKKKINDYFSSKKFDIVIHLAAQAGVRYSLLNPRKYIDVNILGFLNILDALKKNKPKKIFYASSSSVYGDSFNFPLKETEKLNPKNIYGVSKKINEIIADYYSNTFKMKLTGMRFFTIYGEWGRPDMFFLKLFRSIKLKRIFYLNNYGNHIRDFTYIGDVFNILNKLIYKKQLKHEIYNFCSNNPINITKIVNDIRSKYYVKIKLSPLHKADIIKTHGSNNKILRKTGYKKFMNIQKGIDKTIKWYEKYQIEKIT